MMVLKNEDSCYSCIQLPPGPFIFYHSKVTLLTDKPSPVTAIVSTLYIHKMADPEMQHKKLL